MKKIVMVVCFALCGTFAFAQTRHSVAKANMNDKQSTASMELSAPQARPSVGYNASIFTKAEGDELFRCEFSAAEQENSIFSTGLVRADDRINGQDVPGSDAHAQQGSYGTWTWYDSSSIGYLQRKNLATGYPLLYRWFGNNMERSISEAMDTTQCSSDNGWMFMEVFDQTTIGGAAFNAYITFKQFNLQDAPVFDVEFYQWYMKFYDQCFVDYSLDNGDSWTSVEVNVTNVDVIVNGTVNGVARYTMPYQAARRANDASRGEDKGNIRLRLRWYSNVKSTFAGYGYAWMVDDFRVVAGGESRINTQPAYYTEGLYQMMPEGMDLPIFWHSRIVNAGSKDQENIKAYIYNYRDGQSAEVVSASTNGALERGMDKDIYIDAEGLYANDSTYGWYCMRGNVKKAIDGNTNRVKTNEAGDYYVYAQVTSNPSGGDPVNDMITKTYDTIYYNVNGKYGDVDAYVWGHDNGVIIANRAYTYGFTTDGESGNNYITEYSPNYNYGGYSVSVRYTINGAVPTDGNGEPWVIRGVEYVPATDTFARKDRSIIIPTLTADSCTDGEPNTVRFNTVVTGAGQVVVESGDPMDQENPFYLFTPGALYDNHFFTRKDYTPIFVEFPEQPVLEAGKSYRVGYTLAENGRFAVAASAPAYWTEWLRGDKESSNDSIRYMHFADSADLAKYASRTAQAGMLDNPYDVRIFDNRVESNLWASYYHGYYPMIHLIIGPKVEKEQYDIAFSCDNDGMSSALGQVTKANGTEVCDATDKVNEGSTVSYYARSTEQAHVDSIAIDGEYVWSINLGWNEELDEDFKVELSYEEGNDSLIGITLLNVHENHTVAVFFKEGRTVQPEGINDVASNVNMNLQPNPATSQVRLSVEGVSGMLDCAIIDMSGRVVYNDKFSAESPKFINLGGLNKGAYFVRITNSTFSKVEKLIVR